MKLLKKKTKLFSVTICMLVSQIVAGESVVNTNVALQWPNACAKNLQNIDSNSSVRLPPLATSEMTAAQIEAAKKLSASPRGCVFGPFAVLIRSPEFLTRAQVLGEYLRFHGDLPPKLRELSILMVGKEFNQPYIWYIHEPEAIKAGLSTAIIDAIANGVRPINMTNDESVVYEFSRQSLKVHQVNNATYNQAKILFGEKGIVDLVGINGYFAMLGMILNVAKTPLPKGVHIPFKNQKDAAINI